MHFLYPCDPFNSKDADEQFKTEYDKAKDLGLNVHLFDSDDLAATKIIPAIQDDEKVIYRGWMLSLENYQLLERKCNLLTSSEKYIYTHHLPNWYVDLKDLTIESYITDEKNAKNIMQALDRPMFIKDYVKSLKTGKGSVVDNADDIDRALNDMNKFRGTIEGGIVLREVTQFKENTENRFFVVNNQLMSPPHAPKEQFEMALKVVDTLKNHHLFFYSIDVATTINNSQKVVEIGDAQVSDYVGWNIEDFSLVLNQVNKEEYNLQSKKGHKL